ncbi:hypothetical protein Agub_g13455 [Astrephomene gubernaculifera]|uniref:Uncharacterized protein n=1 Tax=Astrephomene gubernaculifera TaxID=47775 RepID=A0AAD3E003_9CHLO|nr:hypothetical protein Agub_g13455 [Astrephomene gubernaculifera]
MDPLLDALTLSPAAQLFELEPPRYTSSYGRRTEAIFKTSVPPAPMLISPDNGLVLYERVISTKAEHQLLDKLTKPKYYHPIPNIRKGLDRKPSSIPNHISPSGSTPASCSSRPHSPGSQRPGSAHSHPHSHTTFTGSSAQSGSRTASAGGSLSASSGPHHAAHRSVSSSSAGGAGPASSGGGGAAGGRGGHHHAQNPYHVQLIVTQSHHRSRSVSPATQPIRRKPLYPEEGPLKDYFSKERASVTATTVFTWGNRYKIGESSIGRVMKGSGGGAAASRSSGGTTEPLVFTSHTPLQHKPPLRL